MTIFGAMRSAYDVEFSLWTAEYQTSSSDRLIKCWVSRGGVGHKVIESERAQDCSLRFQEMRSDASWRAAVTALAGQFNDPVVNKALLWAAKEGDKQ